eukprot:PhM_4_TR2510/c0_g1_i1/m.55195
MLRATLSLAMHGKPTTSCTKRSRHMERWFLQARANRLTYKPINELWISPNVQPYNEEVMDHPVLPDHTPCFQCKQAVDTDQIGQYVWVPSGNTKKPSDHGYVFHHMCFRCAKCKYRFYGNKFASKDGQALCLYCVRGITHGRPSRRWHLPKVDPGREGSRPVGAIWPRYPDQEEWLFDPET